MTNIGFTSRANSTVLGLKAFCNYCQASGAPRLAVNSDIATKQAMIVLVGLGFTLWTGWLPWDPIFAILIAINIFFSGFGLIRKSISGLMDAADPQVQRQLIDILERETRERRIQYHHLRHRSLGDLHWVDFHLLFPQDTSIRDAHRAATEIEKVIETTLEPGAHVTSHLEAIEDHTEVHANEIH